MMDLNHTSRSISYSNSTARTGAVPARGMPQKVGGVVGGQVWGRRGVGSVQFRRVGCV